MMLMMMMTSTRGKNDDASNDMYDAYADVNEQYPDNADDNDNDDIMMK